MKNYKPGIFLLGLLLPIVIIWSCQNASTDPKPTKSYIKSATSFDFDKVPSLNFDTTASIGVISEEKRTITLQVPFGVDVTTLVPTIKLSEKTSVSPDSGVPQDFSKPVNYILTSEDGSRKAYAVTVKVSGTVDFLLNTPKDTIYLAPDEVVAPGAFLTLTGGNFRDPNLDKVVLTSQTSAKKYTFPVFSSTSSQLVFKMPTDLPKDSYSFTLYVGNQFVKPGTTLWIVKLPKVTSFSSNIKHLANMTITGTNLGLVNKVSFTGGPSITQGSFISQSETSIVVTVPVTATAGKLVLTTSSGLKVNTDPITIVLPNVTAFTPSSVFSHNPGTTLTMDGTNLDMVQKISFPSVSTPVTTFTSQSATQIKVVIPANTTGGTVVLTTVQGVAVPVGLPFGNQLSLVTVLFDDAVKAPLGAGGGWGGVTTDAANTEQIRIGTKAIKVTYGGGWGGGAQFGNWSGSSVSTGSNTYYAFSIYGGPGTAGKNINVNVAGKQVQVPFAEGSWTDVKIPLTSFSSPATVSEIWFQDTGWSGVVYIDQIGFK